MTENPVTPPEPQPSTQPSTEPSAEPSSDDVRATGPIAAAADLSLRAAVLELEQHAAEGGWDQPARLFALVPTDQLLADEPGLAPVLGIEPGADLTGSLTPIEQDELPPGEAVEDLLAQMVWPDEVLGTAVIVERLVLPPSVGDLPDDATEAQELAQTHPDRQEVRMIAGATRAGTTYCALRLRSHDDALAVIEGPDLVPALLELLQGTLAPADQ